MASWTATCAALASLIVCSFVALDSVRSSVSLAIAASSSFTAAVRSAISWVNSAIVAVKSSISDSNSLTSAVFLSRVCLFVVNSVSHQPLCSVSEVASSINFTIRSLIIFFTFVNGLASALKAIADNKRLPVLRACSLRKDATFCCRGFMVLLLNCDNACILVLSVWSNVGRYFSPDPATAWLEMISIALDIASSSPARSSCRLSKSVFFCVQRATVSSKYF
mmetsp:Transcript_60811/g.96503  ORF Transcript_60811/g.96503 Transcript_60811/m.96503 type:complete len:222 (-) Transcript_60811:178-843(-)